MTKNSIWTIIHYRIGDNEVPRMDKYTLDWYTFLL